MKHDYYTSCGRDECDGSCNLCTLAVCKACGGGEGSLTTECPGEKYDYDAVYAGVKDYRNGEWVDGCTVHLVNKYIFDYHSVDFSADALIKIESHFYNDVNELFDSNIFEGQKWQRPGANWRCRFATFNSQEYCEQRTLEVNNPRKPWRKNLYSHTLCIVTGVMKPATVDGKRIYLP